VRRLAARVKTAVNLGYSAFLGPAADTQQENQTMSELKVSRNIKSAIKMIFNNVIPNDKKL
jgi:hypothetical protein